MVVENRKIIPTNAGAGAWRSLTLDDLTLHILVKKGTVVKHDITCNSKFMLDALNEIGTSIRQSYHWVSFETPIYLFMDNAGGHGTKEAKDEFVRSLQKNIMS